MIRPQPPHQPQATAPIHEAAALHRAGRLAEAAAIYQKILKKNPRDPDALHLLGLATGQQGDLQAGLAWIAKAVNVRDDFPDAHSNAAQYAAQLGNFPLAEQYARKATVYRPNALTYTNLGRLLRAQDRYEEALAAFRAAHECNPRDIEGYIAYARALRMTDDAKAMLAVAEAGLRLAPDHPTLHLLASEAHFGLGAFEPGWRAYAYRFRSLENRTPAKPYKMPMWRGEDLTGRTLLIWAEQGPGDEIMYANMYADALARAGRCVIQSTPRLAPIMRRSFPGAEIFDRDLRGEEWAGIDYQTPAASLGEWLRPARDTFPDTAGYVKADATLRETLRARYLATDKNRILVGLAWRSSNTTNDTDKSLNILEFGPILKVPGVTFVNLQYGDCALELSEAARGFGVHIIHDSSIDPLKDMDAYAAQVAAMDFVVSSSNTAVHVAGALGVPAVCMLPVSLDHGRRCYWLADGERTPWYPSLRLIKQRQPNQWLDVIRDAGLAVLDCAVAKLGVSSADYYRTMISGFASMKRGADAEAVCEHMAHDPALAAEAYLNIAELRRAALDAPGVFAACDKAIAADPGCWEAYNQKGITLHDLHRFDEAIAVYLQGLQQNATSHLLHSNLGKSNHHLGRYAEALHHHGQALALVPPDKSSALIAIRLNYASALGDSGDINQALAMIDKIIEDAPETVDAHYNRALILLALERWRDGWREFAWRLKRSNVAVTYDAFPHIKPWAGESLTGKKVLIWAEHGIGDEILASTMLPDAIAAARKVVVLCSERLVPLFRRSFPGITAEPLKVPLPQITKAPDFDFQMALWDLGIAFRSDADAFKPRTRFLVSDAQRTASLRKRYASLKPGNLIVGVSWASPSNQEMGWLKASRLESWLPILQVPGTTFVNLQYGDQRPTLARFRDEFGIEIVNDTSIDPLKDMDAYAAQVAAMDLVISTSNTLVHTAGAVGTPTWVLLAKGRGQIWYWLQDRADSLWYASVRLIRQETAGDWTQPIETCARDLREMSQKRRESGKS